MRAGAVWVAERVGTCDRCQGDGLELCEAPESGTFDYCRGCWSGLGIGGESVPTWAPTWEDARDDIEYDPTRDADGW